MLRRSIIAAVIGSSCGAIVGYWAPSGNASVDAPAATVIGPIAAPTPAAVVAAPSPVAEPSPAPESTPKAIVPMSAPLGAPASAPSLDTRDPRQRARELAKRVDVSGLIALREEVAARATQAGQLDAPATKQQLDEIDRYLTEARVLRLKLDAAELRKGASRGGGRDEQERFR